jgi:hypothetical protein
MPLAPRLDTIESLYQKLEREFYRIMHSGSPLHQVDHFYNFCITAHSMRDYLLERLGRSPTTDRLEYSWANKPETVAVADIANSVKHFQLRHRRSGMPRMPLTREVRAARQTMVDLYLSSDGSLVSKKRPGVPTLKITPFDGHTMELYTFTRRVLDYWRSCLNRHGIRPRKQSEKTLRGSERPGHR